MEQSVIHIKAPHVIHIAAKVNAAKVGKSMNQYVIDLIAKDTGEDSLGQMEHGLKILREDNPKNITELVKTAAKAGATYIEKTKQPMIKGAFCKNGHPIPEGRTRCLGKGCKYA